MFGILKKASANAVSYRGKAYCGTCKSIGKLYGHGARLLLNYDAAFLTELIDSFNDNSYLRGVTENKCLALPNTVKEIPNFLQYTSSINVVLAYYKFLDNIVDAKTRFTFWKIPKLISSQKFEKAIVKLKEFGVCQGFLEAAIKQQNGREYSAETLQEFSQTLHFYSELTSNITAYVFSKGAQFISNKKATMWLNDIGESFGAIVYIWDALNDIHEDQAKKRFNPLLLNSELSMSKKKEYAKDFISQKLSILENNINSLPIDGDLKKQFISRLNLNIYTSTPQTTTRPIRPLRFWPIAYRKAVHVATSKQHSHWLIKRKLRYAGFFIASIVVFLAFPKIVNAGNTHLAACICDKEPGAVGFQCGRDLCNGEPCAHSSCSEWLPGCCLFAGFWATCGPCLGACGKGCADNDGPKVITITKIVEVDKGCGKCN